MWDGMWSVNELLKMSPGFSTLSNITETALRFRVFSFLWSVLLPVTAKAKESTPPLHYASLPCTTLNIAALIPCETNLELDGSLTNYETEGKTQGFSLLLGPRI